MLAFLAFHKDGVRRCSAAEQLWPDCTMQRAAANLRSALCQARRAGSANVIDSVDHCLRLSSPVWVDLHDVGSLAQEVLSGRGVPHRAADGLVDELGRELLTGWSDSWLLLERERWDQLRLHTLEALAQQFQVAQQYVPALHTALAAIAIDRVRETAHRIVMEVHIAEGNVASAFKCYQEYKAFLDRELSVAPSRRMTQLAEDLMPM